MRVHERYWEYAKAIGCSFSEPYEQPNGQTWYNPDGTVMPHMYHDLIASPEQKALLRVWWFREMRFAEKGYTLEDLDP